MWFVYQIIRWPLDIPGVNGMCESCLPFHICGPFVALCSPVTKRDVCMCDCECISLPFASVFMHSCVNVGVWGGGVCVDGLSGSPGPRGTALVNNSDEAHYQGSGDFSLIPP